MRSCEWALGQDDWWIWEAGRGNEDTDTHAGKTMWGHSEQVAICKPRSSASEDTALTTADRTRPASRTGCPV